MYRLLPALDLLLSRQSTAIDTARIASFLARRGYASQPEPIREVSPVGILLCSYTSLFLYNSLFQFIGMIVILNGLQPSVKLLINGEFRESKATAWVDVTNPVGRHLFFSDRLTPVCIRNIALTPLAIALQATQEVISRLPETTPEEFNEAVQAAKDAFPKWRNTSLPTRSRVMFKLQELIRRHMVCSATCKGRLNTLLRLGQHSIFGACTVL